MKKKNSLLRLVSKIYNTPHFISQDSFEVILSYLENRNLGLDSIMPVDNGDEQDDNDENEIEPIELDDNSGIGIVCVHGVMTYKPVVGMCGEVDGTSYLGLVEQIESMAEAGVKTIIMDFASGGGEASHCFSFAQEVRDICDENDITLYAYIDERACSAAYVFACQCDEVIIHPSAEAGSIGCVVALTDVSKAMEQAGIKRIYITSGSEKVPFAADGSFKQDFIDKLQVEVDALNTQFANHVSKYTGLSVDTIKGFEAATFNAEDCIKNGLANYIMDRREFVNYVAAKQKPNMTGAM